MKTFKPCSNCHKLIYLIYKRLEKVKLYMDADGNLSETIGGKIIKLSGKQIRYGERNRQKKNKPILPETRIAVYVEKPGYDYIARTHSLICGRSECMKTLSRIGAFVCKVCCRVHLHTNAPLARAAQCWGVCDGCFKKD